MIDRRWGGGVSTHLEILSIWVTNIFSNVPRETFQSANIVVQLMVRRSQYRAFETRKSVVNRHERARKLLLSMSLVIACHFPMLSDCLNGASLRFDLIANAHSRQEADTVRLINEITKS